MTFTKNQTLRNVIILTVLTFLVFLPCVWNDFLTWDDPSYLTQNPQITSFPSNLTEIFSTFTMGSYAPLTIVSLAIEYYFFKFNPFIYHLDNILLHILNVLLVYALIVQIDGRHRTALFATLFFAVNPLRVESVAWVSERKDLLFAFFYLTTMITYIKAVRSGRPWLHWATFAFFLCAIFSKPQALSLVFSLLVLDYFLKNRITVKDLLEKTPHLLTTFLLMLVGAYGLSTISQYLTLAGSLSILDKTILSNFALHLYFLLSVFPVHTSFFYPNPEKINNLFPYYVYLAVPVSIYLIYMFTKRFRNERQWHLAALLFFVAIALPITNIWVDGYFISERFMYLPSIWLFYMIVQLLEKIPAQFKMPQSYITTLFVITVGFYGILSLGKCFVWKNDLTLWGNVIDTFPNHAMGYTVRGDKFREFGFYDLALNDLNQALAISPNSFEAYYSRGTLYKNHHQYGLAASDFKQALFLKPQSAEAKLNYMTCLKNETNETNR